MPLARSDSPQTLLDQVATQVARIEESSEQQDISACVQVLAGLRFKKNLIQQLFRRETMRESVIYQDILEEGRQEGRHEGRQEGEVAVILRQLSRRLGAIAPTIQESIRALSSPQLEELAEALLDFTQETDLTNWLSNRGL